MTDDSIPSTQRPQYPLIKEYTLNYSRIPTMIYGIFLNYGIMESLGIPFLRLIRLSKLGLRWTQGIRMHCSVSCKALKAKPSWPPLFALPLS